MMKVHLFQEGFQLQHLHLMYDLILQNRSNKNVNNMHNRIFNKLVIQTHHGKELIQFKNN